MTCSLPELAMSPTSGRPQIFALLRINTSACKHREETPPSPPAQHSTHDVHKPTQSSPVPESPIIHRVVQVDDGAPRKDELLPHRCVVGHQPIYREGRVSSHP